MAGILHTYVPNRVIDSNGVSAGAELYFYYTGTLTLAPIYDDVDLETPLANPVVVDGGAAVPDIYLDPAITYRRRVVPSDGSDVQDTDPWQALPSQLFAPDGTSGSPSVSFLSDPDSGLYRVGANIVGIAAGGAGIAQFSSAGAGIGSAPGTARLTIQTDTDFTGNAQHIYHYGDQATVDNQTNALAVHNYTNAKAVQIDNLGNKAALSLKQALNDAAWPAHGVGTGDFLEALRARTSGAGNTGDGVDILVKLDKQGCLRFYGTDGEDWDGTDTTAPIQFGSYTDFFTMAGYLGWDHTNERMVVGSIESGVAFKPVHFACSAMTVLGDGTVPLATALNPLETVHTYRLNTKPVAVALLPSAATAGAGARAFVSDANATTFASVVAAGGANKVPVYSDGTDWRIG